MPKPQVTITIWLSLPKEIRQKIVAKYQLPRSGTTHVTCQNNKFEVISDGYTHEDLAKIPVYGEDPYAILDALLEQLDPEEVEEPDTPQPVRVKFCDFCTSRGMRHKKNCTRNEPVQKNGIPDTF